MNEDEDVWRVWGAGVDRKQSEVIMRHRTVPASLVLAMLAAMVGEAQAQMFDGRTTRGSAGRRSASSRAAAGTVINQRFVRGNRSSRDFVGTDTTDRDGFVGAQQADTSGSVQTAQTGLQPEKAPDATVNQSAAAPTTLGMYNPRLQVDFAVRPSPAKAMGYELSRRTERALWDRLATRIEVTVDGRTATLRGAVLSERDRTLAETLLTFEPGISEVRNELLVQASARPATEAPPRRRIRSSGPREF
jgi:hypothetical protein